MALIYIGETKNQNKIVTMKCSYFFFLYRIYTIWRRERAQNVLSHSASTRLNTHNHLYMFLLTSDGGGGHRFVNDSWTTIRNDSFQH